MKISIVSITFLSLKADLRAAVHSALIPYALLKIYMLLQMRCCFFLPFLSSGSNIFPPEERSSTYQSAVKKLGSINSGEPCSSWGRGKKKKNHKTSSEHNYEHSTFFSPEILTKHCKLSVCTQSEELSALYYLNKL